MTLKNDKQMTPSQVRWVRKLLKRADVPLGQELSEAQGLVSRHSVMVKQPQVVLPPLCPLWLNKANALWSLCRHAGWASGPHWRRKRDVLVKKKKNVFFVTPVQLFWHTSWTVFNTLTDCKSRSISCQSNHSRLGSFTNSAAKPAFGLRLPWPRLSLPPEILLIPFILSPF